MKLFNLGARSLTAVTCRAAVLRRAQLGIMPESDNSTEMSLRVLENIDKQTRISRTWRGPVGRESVD